MQNLLLRSADFSDAGFAGCCERGSCGERQHYYKTFLIRDIPRLGLRAFEECHGGNGVVTEKKEVTPLREAGSHKPRTDELFAELDVERDHATVVKLAEYKGGYGMRSPDLADPWVICQALIYDAIDEIYRKQEEESSLHEPWAGIFAPRELAVPWRSDIKLVVNTSWSCNA